MPKHVLRHVPVKNVLARHVLGQMLSHVPRHMLKHVLRHMLTPVRRHVLEHVPQNRQPDP